MLEIITGELKINEVYEISWELKTYASTDFVRLTVDQFNFFKCSFDMVLKLHSSLCSIMGCSASKASQVVVPMPAEVKQNVNLSQEDNKTQELAIEAQETTARKPIQVKQRSEDSLHGSQCSLNSNSDSGRSDRESSAKSTRTTDSGLGELEDCPNIISERSARDKQKIVLAEERPPTPGLFAFDFC